MDEADGILAYVACTVVSAGRSPAEVLDGSSDKQKVTKPFQTLHG